MNITLPLTFPYCEKRSFKISSGVLGLTPPTNTRAAWFSGSSIRPLISLTPNLYIEIFINYTGNRKLTLIIRRGIVADLTFTRLRNVVYNSKQLNLKYTKCRNTSLICVNEISNDLKLRFCCNLIKIGTGRT